MGDNDSRPWAEEREVGLVLAGAGRRQREERFDPGSARPFVEKWLRLTRAALQAEPRHRAGQSTRSLSMRLITRRVALRLDGRRDKPEPDDEVRPPRTGLLDRLRSACAGPRPPPLAAGGISRPAPAV
jgi:hypothetical protein